MYLKVKFSPRLYWSQGGVSAKSNKAWTNMPKNRNPAKKQQVLLMTPSKRWKATECQEILSCLLSYIIIYGFNRCRCYVFVMLTKALCGHTAVPPQTVNRTCTKAIKILIAPTMGHFWKPRIWDFTDLAGRFLASFSSIHLTNWIEIVFLTSEFQVEVKT